LYRQLSLIETSSEQPVMAIKWLPNLKLMDSGELVPSPTTHTFITISPDGRLMIWDRDEDYVLPSKKAVKMKSERLRGKWIPLNYWNILTMDGSSSLSCCCMFVHDYNIYFGTQDGDFVVADFSPIEKRSTVIDADDSSGVYKTFNTVNITKSIVKAHFSVCHTVLQHPFFPDYVLSIGSESFKIWKLDCKSPIWTSPHSSVSLTSGAWSPSKPGVLFIGRQDGVIEVWDFLDKSHAPSVESIVHQNVGLTSMQFLSNKYSQYLAVGTSQGSLHVQEVPRNLARMSSPDEETLIANFFTNERVKVDYYSHRFEIHKTQREEIKRAVKVDGESGQTTDNEGELSQERKLELEKLFREMTTKETTL
jgi:WD40 repeat protein